MNRLVKLLGISTGFIFAFLFVVFASSHWLQRNTDDLRQRALNDKKVQFKATAEFAGLPAGRWSEAQVAALSRSIGATIELRRADAKIDSTPTTPTDERWQFIEPLAMNGRGERYEAVVSLPAPPTVRLARTIQYVASALFALACTCLVVLCVAAIWIARRDHTSEPQDDPKVHRTSASDVSSLAQLAKTSVHQGEMLEIERSERLRLEEDLSMHHMLLNRALEQKIRLGQDLHDGIIQSLYANGLTLEAAKNMFPSNPAEARTLIERSQKALNATIREVRSFINGLSPEALDQSSLGESVRSLVATVSGGTEVKFSIDIDDSIADHLPDSEQSDLLQIIREAVSNSIRHSGSAAVFISFRERHDIPYLEIRDTGRGFDPQGSGPRGHGLANIAARSQRLGGACSIESAPGRGTSITLTLSPTRAIVSA